MRSVQKSFDKRFAISSGFPKILYVHCRSNLSQKQLGLGTHLKTLLQKKDLAAVHFCRSVQKYRNTSSDNAEAAAEFIRPEVPVRRDSKRFLP